MNQKEKKCEFLLKINKSQYFKCVFELLDNCCKHYNELKFFKNKEFFIWMSFNHTLKNFFGNFCSYTIVSNENISLSDFLCQTFFKCSEKNKKDIELIKRASSIKLVRILKYFIYIWQKKEMFSKVLIYLLIFPKIILTMVKILKINNFLYFWIYE